MNMHNNNKNDTLKNDHAKAQGQSQASAQKQVAPGHQAAAPGKTAEKSANDKREAGSSDKK